MKYIFYACLVIAFTSCITSKKNNSFKSVTIEKASNYYDLNQQFDFHFIEGCKEKMSSNYNQAIAQFKECLKINSNSAAANYELGYIYYSIQKMDLALKHAQKAAESDVKNIWYQSLYIKCLHAFFKHETVLKVYKKMLSLDTLKKEYKEAIADEYMHLSQYEAAYKTIDDLEKNYSVEESYIIKKIKALMKLRNIKETQLELNRLFKLYPTDENYFFVASYYKDTGLIDSAINFSNKAQQILSKNATILLNLVDLYAVKKDTTKLFNQLKTVFTSSFVDAENKVSVYKTYVDSNVIKNNLNRITLLESIITMHPKHFETYNLLSEAYFLNRNYEKAVKSSTTSISLNKNQYEIWAQIAMLYMELLNYNLVEKYTTDAMEVFPNQPFFYLYNGIALHYLKNYNAAIDILKIGFEKVISNKTILTSFHSELAELYNQTKEYHLSDKHFEELLQIDKDNPIYLNNYAYYLSLRNTQLEKAEQLSALSNSITPNNDTFMDTYGWVLFQQKKYTQAIEWLKKATDINNKNAVILEHLGDAYYKAGYTQNALEFWKRAYKIGTSNSILEQKIKLKKITD